MITKNDILAKLQNGEDPEKIANDFSTMLNEAMKDAKRIQKEKEAQAVANEKKLADAQKILDAIAYYKKTWAPGVLESNCSAKDVVALFESLEPLELNLKTFSDHFKNKTKDELLDDFFSIF